MQYFLQQPISLNSRTQQRHAANPTADAKKKVFSPSEWETELSEMPVNKRYACAHDASDCEPRFCP